MQAEVLAAGALWATPGGARDARRVREPIEDRLPDRGRSIRRDLDEGLHDPGGGRRIDRRTAVCVAGHRIRQGGEREGPNEVNRRDFLMAAGVVSCAPFA